MNSVFSQSTSNSAERNEIILSDKIFLDSLDNIRLRLCILILSLIYFDRHKFDD